MFIDDFNQFPGSEGGIEPPEGGGLVIDGELRPSPNLQKKIVTARRERWALKWHADQLRAGILATTPSDTAENRAFRKKFIYPRRCHRGRRFTGFDQNGNRVYSDWTINYSNELHKAFHQGQETCGSVWQCPVCAAKIAERRRIELQEAMNNAKQMGLTVLMLTLTVRHGMGDDVNDILKKMLKALAAIMSGRKGEAIRKQIGKVGHVRVLEVTHGSNGFHPHFHILLFIEKPVPAKVVEDLFAQYWIDQCVKAGLPVPVREIACNVQSGDKAQNYISKWGMIDEMTRGHIKKGRAAEGADGGAAGRTPWQLLDDSRNGDPVAGKLFIVYAAAFYNKRQLVWSRGLRDLLGLDKQMSDQEIVDAPDDVKATPIVTLQDHQINVLIKMKLLDKVLEVCEKDFLLLQDYIDNVTNMYYNENKRERRLWVTQAIHEMGGYNDD